MHCPVPVKNVRRVLCVFPAYTPAFATFEHAYALMGDVRAFMPPQGLLVIAAYLPPLWDVRFIDENIAPAKSADFAWADIVFVSGMHVQAPQINDIDARAKAAGKITVLGGSSVSAAPDMYSAFDYLHIGEIGDATDELIATLDACIEPPPRQIRFETKERLPLADFPLPAYDKVPLKRYLLASIQFSSGCPYRCEFCDIPALYGRQPRLKSPAQIIRELDAVIAQPNPPTVVYFVDDNFIGNRRAAREMLPHLVEWQKRHGYRIQFACEATLNIAKQPEILELMRQAAFVTVFVGIETPELEALKSIAKEQNAAVPILEGIRTLNSYGLEVTSGIIFGLDSETAESERRLIEFVEASQVPILTMNLLQALPRTPLWDRLVKAGRLLDDPNLESNVRFLRPHDEVLASWRRTIAYCYAPERVFARYRHQIEATYAHRIRTPARAKLTWRNIRRGLILTFNLTLRIGILADYRRVFWAAVRHALMHGRIEDIFGMTFVAHHLIVFTRDALRGKERASFYTAKPGELPEPSSLEQIEQKQVA
jgi:hopanoid C-2 methylase